MCLPNIWKIPYSLLNSAHLSLISEVILLPTCTNLTLSWNCCSRPPLVPGIHWILMLRLVSVSMLQFLTGSGNPISKKTENISKWLKVRIFCFQNCSDLLWEKNVLLIEKNTFEIQGWRPRICKHFEITETIHSNSER